jgi:hypothetical protein
LQASTSGDISKTNGRAQRRQARLLRFQWQPSFQRTWHSEKWISSSSSSSGACEMGAFYEVFVWKVRSGGRLHLHAQCFKLKLRHM